MEGEDEFNDIFNKFRPIKGKFDSLYIFVVYDTKVETLKERLKKYMESFDKISDNVRRGYAKTKVYEAQQYTDGLEGIINGIFMFGGDIEHIPLKKRWRETLVKFKCPFIQIANGNHYDIDWLMHLLLDVDYINVFHLHGNEIRQYQLNSTKKNIVYSSTIKSMNLDAIIKERISKDEKYCIHGVSVTLKGFTDPKAMFIESKDLRDEEILDKMEISKYKMNSTELENCISTMTMEKNVDKIVFGKDIEIAIQQNLLKYLFCTPKKAELVRMKLPKDKMIFTIKVVKSFNSGDVGDILERDYKGAIGVKFY